MAVSAPRPVPADRAAAADAAEDAAGLAVTTFVASVVSVVVASQGFVLRVLAGRHHRPLD